MIVMPAVTKSSRAKPKAKAPKKQPLILSNRNNKPSPKKPQKERNEKGIIYVKHIPHGFFESQLRSFFSQFGDVSRVHVARSKKTLRSRGYAYVEFRYREVAQIAAETMNNYFMFGKILKTGVLPAGANRIPRKYEKAFDANGNETSTYKLWLQRMVAKSNGRVTKTKVVGRNKRASAKLNKMKKKFAEMGVEYNVDDVMPDFNDSDLKMPEHDAEEEQIQAGRAMKKTRQQQKVDNLEISVQSMDAGDEPSEDSSDEDDDTSFLPLESADWDVGASDSDGSSGENQEAPKGKKQSKVAAVQFATNTKTRIDKEKKKQPQKANKRPLVLKPVSASEDSSPEKALSKKQKSKAKVEALSQSEPDSSPAMNQKVQKKKGTQKSNKDKKSTGKVVKNPKGKKKQSNVNSEVKSPLRAAAKALLQDPSVKKVKGKDINKKKKK